VTPGLAWPTLTVNTPPKQSGICCPDRPTVKAFAANQRNRFLVIHGDRGGEKLFMFANASIVLFICNRAHDCRYSLAMNL
jgi:hypothetical protein